MEKSKCELCHGEMPEGEEMFRYHGYSGDCPQKGLNNSNNFVARVVKRAIAIDHTPIYHIAITKYLKPGDLIRFDTEEDLIFKD